MPSAQVLTTPINRQLLASFLSRNGADPRLIRAFENLFLDVSETLPGAIDDTDTGEVGSSAVLAAFGRSLDRLTQLQQTQAQVQRLEKRVRDLERLVSQSVA